MEYYGTDCAVKTYVLRLDQGDLVLESIKALIEKEKIRTGAVVSGVGTLDRFICHMVTTTAYPPVEYFHTVNDVALELASLQGAIVEGVPHVHMVVSDTKSAIARASGEWLSDPLPRRGCAASV